MGLVSRPREHFESPTRPAPEPHNVKLVFPLVGHPYQSLHSLPIAASLATRHVSVTVHIAGMSEQHLQFARALVARHAGPAPIHYDLLHVPRWLQLRWALRGDSGRKYAPGKSLMLLANRNYFRSFDALVTAERTSLTLRRWGRFTRPMIYTTHGAGDREISVTSELTEFDYLLLAGSKHEQRLLELDRTKSGHYATGVYAKLDWLHISNDAQQRLFANERPTVLYAPHFSPRETSWFSAGHSILEQFASSRRFNLVFAPHVRLFDPPSATKLHAFRRYLDVPHMLIDLGSERCIDMTYTKAADLYLGDVSSQIAEFLSIPRPCLFLNMHRVAWQQNPSYRFWHSGPVIESVDDIERHVGAAFDSHASFLEIQKQYVADTFGSYPLPTAMADRGADAIISFLRCAPTVE